ncbi:FlgN protein [Clostridium amylolyticum]|uniref:FlgN protein n=1 Tax=Clostridium amylolyticum TaxID=1121298 RepID=A0A1M6CDC4_9CLOT|nr:flagellar protein FlgN [Clostridium amylolyticum]SHI58708.1 FlgN protein [Clostridium amylolyticum]
MREELKVIMKNEYEALSNLLYLMDKQYALIMKKDIFGLDKIIEEIQWCNKKVAETEVARRKLSQGKAMKDIINVSSDEELDNLYRNIVKILEEITLQKDTNELLIKQSLSYTNRMLSYINPNRNTVTYDSYGKFKR